DGCAPRVSRGGTSSRGRCAATRLQTHGPRAPPPAASERRRRARQRARRPRARGGPGVSAGVASPVGGPSRPGSRQRTHPGGPLNPKPVTSDALVTGLDWIIVVFVIAMALWGFVQGLIVGALSLVGFAGGAVIGA